MDIVAIDKPCIKTDAGFSEQSIPYERRQERMDEKHNSKTYDTPQHTLIAFCLIRDLFLPRKVPKIKSQQCAANIGNQIIDIRRAECQHL